MTSRELPPAEPEVAKLFQRLEACYFDHANRMVLDPWVRDEARFSAYDEIAAGALGYMANDAVFRSERDEGLAYLDRADEIFARTPATRESVLARWVTFNARGLLVRTPVLTRESLREAIEHHMAGMRFAAAHDFTRGIAVSGLNAGWELVRLGEPVEALMLMTRLLEMNTFDRRRYALIREVTGLALTSAGYHDEALGQFQIALDWIEPTFYVHRVRISLQMANCALDAERLDIASFAFETARSVLDYIEAEGGSTRQIEKNHRYLNQINARILVRSGEFERAQAIVNDAPRVDDDLLVHLPNTALDVWLHGGKAHFAFDNTVALKPMLGGQLRYAVLLEQCAAQTGRFELALKLRREINSERARYSIGPDVVVKLSGPDPSEIKQRQQQTEVELAQIIALAEWHDNLLDMTAHELRGPLTALQLASELLADDAAGARERLQTLVPMVERMRRTTEGFQALIQIADDPTAPTIEARRISDELGVAVDSLREAARAKNIDLRATGLDQEFHAHVTAGSVVISVANLISNAIKYSPPGTAIDVAASQAGDRIILDVRDQGPGIAAHDRTIAFDWQVRLNHKPTGGESSQGLGLAITRTLVETAGGTAEILDPPPDRPGAHLRITWRAAPSEPSTSASAEPDSSKTLAS